MVFNINTLLNKMLFELKIFNPKYCRQFDDPRIDSYYISINQHNYMVLNGICDECDNIIIYNNNNINHNIMTTRGIENFVNKDEIIDDTSIVIFELELDTFNGNINDLIILLTNLVKKIVPL